MDSEIETRLIFIAPTSDLTPDRIARFIHNLGNEVTVKETCYGVVVEGPKEAVRHTLGEVRKLDPNRIFSKVRAFPVGDVRRCRAHHGSRPGFAQLEKEWKDLCLVEQGLICVEEGERPPTPKKRGRLPIKELRKIVDEVSQ
ncbi:MAG TPA: methanogenesis marker protein 6 [Methanomassiliicoccales archaeon]|nr:methanogenesis marker protein 6 [Methanomassiliicoccales archaeon]